MSPAPRLRPAVVVRLGGFPTTEKAAMTETYPLTDSQLVGAICRRSEEGLAEAYQRHAAAVFGLARRVLRELTLAEEVVQDVFLRLWLRPQAYQPERGSLRTYLLTQAHSRAIDALRSATSRRRREERATAEARHSEHHPSSLVADGFVEQAMNGLTTDQRQAIELAFFEGLTYEETAARLRQPEGTIKSRIRSGLRAMRTSLSAVLPGESGNGRAVLHDTLEEAGSNGDAQGSRGSGRASGRIRGQRTVAT